MHMLYNSDSFVVVQIDVPVDGRGRVLADGEGGNDQLTRGGYEIVDKFARKEIFIEGALAERFKEGVDALIETSPTEEEMDDFLAGFSSLMQHPVVMH